jgi:sec-independent protein translocase protein TatA
MANLQGWHLLILLAVILLLFGAAKLPALAKSVGQSARVFKGEMKAMKDENGTVDTPADGTATSTPADQTASASTPKSPADTPDSKS